MSELTPEDKQRIYKEVNRIFNESESVDLVHTIMFKAAEYATIYEREKQAKELGEAPENVNYGSPEHLRYVIRKLKAEKEKLEAERTKLVKLLREISWRFDCIVSDSASNADKKLLKEIENSLKK